MPCSNTEGKSEILDWVIRQPNVKKIVDFGPGVGTYYYLIKPERPDIYFIAVEIYYPYIQNFMLRNYYDEVICADMLTCDLPDADCAILGDVLEHLSDKDALRAFERIDQKYNHVIIAVPWGTDAGRPVLGNPHEMHKSFWTFEKMSRLIGEKYRFKLNFLLGGVFIK